MNGFAPSQKGSVLECQIKVHSQYLWIYNVIDDDILRCEVLGCIERFIIHHANLPRAHEAEETQGKCCPEHCFIKVYPSCSHAAFILRSSSAVIGNQDWLWVDPLLAADWVIFIPLST